MASTETTGEMDARDARADRQQENGAGVGPSRKAAEDESRFPYADYFSEVNVMPALLMMPDEIPWLRQIPRDPERYDTVLYLGCQALKTPQFCQEAADILSSLGEKTVSVGGSAVCCGSVHQFFGQDLDLARRVSRSSTRKLGSFQSKNVLTICPNCTYEFENGVAAEIEDISFEMTHFYEHVHARLSDLKFTRPLNMTVGIHRHLGTSHHQEAHADLCADLLRAIPGVTLVDLPAFEELGPLCYPAAFRQVSAERHSEIMDTLFSAAIDQGCDAVATIYHACQRELCHEEARGDFEVVSVLGLVARALGHPVREDRLKRMKNLPSVDAAMAMAQPNIAAHGIPPEIARKVIASVLFS